MDRKSLSPTGDCNGCSHHLSRDWNLVIWNAVFVFQLSCVGTCLEQLSRSAPTPGAQVQAAVPSAVWKRHLWGQAEVMKGVPGRSPARTCPGCCSKVVNSHQY